MPRGRSKKSANDASPSAKAAKPEKPNGNGGNLGFEAQLFLAADKLRKNLEPSDYKHVALGLIFLKYSRRWRAGHTCKPTLRPAARVRAQKYHGFSVTTIWCSHPYSLTSLPRARERR